LHHCRLWLCDVATTPVSHRQSTPHARGRDGTCSTAHGTHLEVVHGPVLHGAGSLQVPRVTSAVTPLCPLDNVAAILAGEVRALAGYLRDRTVQGGASHISFPHGCAGHFALSNAVEDAAASSERAHPHPVSHKQHDMHSTTCSAQNVQHMMYSTTCIAQDAYHRMHSTTCIAHCGMHSTGCTARHAQHTVGCIAKDVQHDMHSTLWDA